MSKQKVNIELTKEEAIVLFEFLGRFNEDDDSSRFEDQAEQRVLWNIESSLEKKLSEPLRADFQDIVSKSRERLRDENE